MRGKVYDEREVMPMGVLLIVGTNKGGFLIRSDASRERFSIEGPIFKGWEVTAAGRDAKGRHYLGIASQVYGPTIHGSADLREWRPVERPPGYPEGGRHRFHHVWAIAAAAGRLYAGVDEAGLFQSDDGDSWEPVPGINAHATRDAWQPGNGGLCLHSIVVDPTRPDRIWVGISAVGVFRSDDGGQTFVPKNFGIPVILEDKVHKDIGYCVHALAVHPGEPDVIYRQEHLGSYWSRNAGETWEPMEQGLPSRFGFPLVMDPRTRALYCVPLESDEYRVPPEGRLRVYRRLPEAPSWEPLTGGLPQAHAYAPVLRHAVAVDGLEPAGVYVGTTAGTIHASRDGGDSWRTLPYTLPRILSVDAFLVD